MAAVVDVPAAKRSSTNPTRDAAVADFAKDAAFRGLPIFDPLDPNAPEFVSAMRGLRPDLFLAVGYMLRLGSADLGRSPNRVRQRARLAPAGLSRPEPRYFGPCETASTTAA